MHVAILPTLPEEWKTKKPIRSYETRFLYIGFRRYDTEEKTISSFFHDGSTITYQSDRVEDAVFSRGYSAEIVRVVLYSESPRVWSEELSPHERFVFVQQPTHAVST